jgi:hypothetical protein
MTTYRRLRGRPDRIFKQALRGYPGRRQPEAFSLGTGELRTGRLGSAHEFRIEGAEWDSERRNAVRYA